MCRLLTLYTLIAAGILELAPAEASDTLQVPPTAATPAAETRRLAADSTPPKADVKIALQVLPAETDRLPLLFEQFGPAARTPVAVVSTSGSAAPQGAFVLVGFRDGTERFRRPLQWEGRTRWVARVPLDPGLAEVAVLHTPEGGAERELQRMAVPAPSSSSAVTTWESGNRQRLAAAPTREILLSGSDWRLASFAMDAGEPAGAFRPDHRFNSFRTVTVPGEIPLQIGLSGRELFLQSRELCLINEKEWWYRKAFRTPADAKEKVIRLVFESVDYFSSVWLNGEKLGNNEGGFVPFTSYDISGRLRPDGDNVLVVKVTCPWLPCDRNFYEYIKGEWAFGHGLGISSPAGMLNSFWDGTPAQGNAVFPMGILRDVKLAISGEVAINNLHVETMRLNPDGSAKLLVSATVVNYGAPGAKAKLSWKLAPDNFEGDAIPLPVQNLKLPSGETQVSVQVDVRNPKLWWSWDTGAQNLYRLHADLSVEDQHTTASCVTGIRTIERHDDMSYWLNGRRLFLKGSWYMSDLYLSRRTRSDYEKDLELYRACGLNHLVNFTLVEGPDFYDLCDRLGILNMMELPFNQWGPAQVMKDEYPRREFFVRESIGQMRHVILQLRNHPSIIQWAPFAEVKMVCPDEYAEYGYLNQLRRLVSDLAPGAVFHTSFCESGENHNWTYGFGGGYAPLFDFSPGFVSEYGAQAAPSLELFQKMLTPEQLWSERNTLRPAWLNAPIDVPAWSYLCCFEWENFGLYVQLWQLTQYVDRQPRSANELIEASQLSQSFVLTYGTEAFRRKKYAPICGTRNWYYRDLVPRYGWGVIDYESNPKMAYYGMKRACKPFAASFALKNALEAQPAEKPLDIPVWVINDHLRNVPVEAKVDLLDLSGRTQWEHQFAGTVPSDGTLNLGTVDWTPPAGDQLYVLRAQVREPGGTLTTMNRMVIQVGRQPAGRPSKATPNRPEAKPAQPLPVMTKELTKPLRVLVIGQGKYAKPITTWLAQAGVTTETISEVSVDRFVWLRDPRALKAAYDVVWLCSFDTVWKLMDDEMAHGLSEAIQMGIGFVHTGGEGSFHGGGGRAALLDIRGLAQALPVTLRNGNDVVYGNCADVKDVQMSAARSDGWNAQGLMQSGVGGFNLVEVKPGAEQIMSVCGHPLLVVGRHGAGRTVVFTGFTPENHASGVKLGQGKPGPMPQSYADLFLRMLVEVGGEPLRSVYDRLVKEGRIPEQTAPPAVTADVAPVAPASNGPKLLFQQLKELPEAKIAMPERLDVVASTRRAKATITLNNGDTYARLARLRVDWDGAEAPLTMFSDNYIDLLPKESATIELEILLPEIGGGQTFSGKLALSGPNVNPITVPITVKQK